VKPDWFIGSKPLLHKTSRNLYKNNFSPTFWKQSNKEIGLVWAGKQIGSFLARSKILVYFHKDGRKDDEKERLYRLRRNDQCEECKKLNI